MVEGLDHLGIAVRSLDSAIAFYRDVLGLEHLRTEVIPGQRVRAAFFRVGETAIELLEPTDEGSPIAKHLAARGEGFHHIAFRVGDLEAAIRELEKRGIKLAGSKPAAGARGMRVAFLHPKSTGRLLIELCEHARET